MVQNIFVGLLGAAVVAAGIWGWWIENGRSAGQEEETDHSDVESMAAANEKTETPGDDKNRKAV